MRDIYFATYKLGKKNDSSPRLEEVVPILEDWLFNPRRDIEQPGEYNRFAPEQNFQIDSGTELATRFYDDSQHRAYALRFKHPDDRLEQKRWVTEVTLSEREEQTVTTRASINLFTGYEGAALTHDVDTVSRPRLVKSLIDEFGAYESLPLSLKPRKLASSQVETFVDLLKHDRRVFPVVWISADNSDARPLIDPIPVADWLAGVAHVIVSDGIEPSRKVENFLDSRFNCYDGAVRIYWPGFSEEDSQFDHRLWLAEDVERLEERKHYGFRSHILSYIAEASTNRLVDGVVRWSDVRRLQSRNRLRRLREEGEDEEALEVAEAIIEDLEGENENLRDQLRQTQEEKERARNEAEQWRKAYQEELKSEEDEPSREPSEDLPPATLSDAVESILSKYGPDADETTIRIPDSVQGRITDEFEDVGAAFSALEWLATTFVQSKIGEKSCPDLNHSCKKASGFWYRPHQSEVTMGQYAEDYHIDWRGEKRTLKKHLGKGSSTDPRETLRIAFFFDEELESVVVGYIDQHQRTTAT